MSNATENFGPTLVMSIHSATLSDIVSDFNLLTQEHARQYFSDRTIILELINNFSDIPKIEFLSLTKRDRRMMYIALHELSLPFSKIRIDQNFAIISILLDHQIRHNLNTYHTNNQFLIQKYKNQAIVPNNMQKKLRIADLLFDIKDNMKDSMFKELMDTLNEITN